MADLTRLSIYLYLLSVNNCVFFSLLFTAIIALHTKICSSINVTTEFDKQTKGSGIIEVNKEFYFDMYMSYGWGTHCNHVTW